MSDYNLRRRAAGKNSQIPDEHRVQELPDSYSDSDGQREEPVAKKKRSANDRAADEDDYSPWVDVLRVLSFLVFAWIGLSYLISGGESYTWGWKQTPKALTADYWKNQLVSIEYTLFLVAAKQSARSFCYSSLTDPPVIERPSPPHSHRIEGIRRP